MKGEPSSLSLANCDIGYTTNLQIDDDCNDPHEINSINIVLYVRLEKDDGTDVANKQEKDFTDDIV